MKVGTDAVLLGASTPVSCRKSKEQEGKEVGMEILDIGAGTGVLSLMLAQRAPNAKITAIEIDKAAAEECDYNFNNSPFTKRLNCVHSSLNNYLRTRTRTRTRTESQSSSKSDFDGVYPERSRRAQSDISRKFDLIISNPPFFPGSQAEGSRKKARDSYSLPAEELIKGVDQLLSLNGQFSLILPYLDEMKFRELAAENKLFPFQILRVRGRKDAKIVRSILHFKRGMQKLKEEEVYIEVEKRHEYSVEYLELVREFLLV